MVEDTSSDTRRFALKSWLVLKNPTRSVAQENLARRPGTKGRAPQLDSFRPQGYIRGRGVVLKNNGDALNYSVATFKTVHRSW